MLINSVDADNNLFEISQVVSSDLLNQILSHDWLSMVDKKETHRRHQIKLTELTWGDDLHYELASACRQAMTVAEKPRAQYIDTVFWLDFPGFKMSCHTDGNLSGTMQIYWIGASNLGTVFYHHKNQQSIRKKFDFESNSGYVMSNQSEINGYKPLLWHALPVSVPVDTFRLTSYTWIWMPDYE